MAGGLGDFGRLSQLTPDEIEALAAQQQQSKLDNLSARLGLRGFTDLAPVNNQSRVIGSPFGGFAMPGAISFRQWVSSSPLSRLPGAWQA